MANAECILFFFWCTGLSCTLQIGSFATIVRWKLCNRRSAAYLFSSSLSLLIFFVQIGAFSTCASNFFFLCSGTVLLVCFAYVFFHFDNMGETARRIRLLWELYEYPTGLSTNQLLENYPPEEVFQRRVGRLLQAEQCSDLGDHLVWNGRSYALIQLIMSFWTHLVFGNRNH